MSLVQLQFDQTKRHKFAKIANPKASQLQATSLSVSSLPLLILFYITTQGYCPSSLARLPFFTSVTLVMVKNLIFPIYVFILCLGLNIKIFKQFFTTFFSKTGVLTLRTYSKIFRKPKHSIWIEMNRKVKEHVHNPYHVQYETI